MNALPWGSRRLARREVAPDPGLQTAYGRRDLPSPASGRKPTTLPLRDPHGNGHGWLLRASSRPGLSNCRPFGAHLSRSEESLGPQVEHDAEREEDGTGRLVGGRDGDLDGCR